MKDIDFERRAVVVREGKGAKDRVVMLPAIYTHVLRLGGGAVRSPLDSLGTVGSLRYPAPGRPATVRKVREPTPCFNISLEPRRLHRLHPITPNSSAAAISVS